MLDECIDRISFIFYCQKLCILRFMLFVILQDALLPLLLIEKLMLLVNYVEIARVTGVTVTFIITRGQQIKVISQLYRKAKQHSLVIPTNEVVRNNDKFDGGLVMDPIKAYYVTPIATLDFASLYPSIMMAHNLCYSTLVDESEFTKMSKSDRLRDTIKTPSGDIFVKANVRAGILPEILSELLAARLNAKRLMNLATDPFEIAVLNGRQLALKISANSVYGFTGAQVGELPCVRISRSVTGFGREMIFETKTIIEEEFSISKGYEYDAVVIYGDTDSVMVKFGADNVKDTMALGIAAAKKVSERFMEPIKMEFEKV